MPIKGVKSHNGSEGRICAKEGEDIFAVKERERDTQVHKKTIKERVYQTLKITSNSTSVFCRKERQ